MEALCWEIVGERESSALCVDLSTEGVRVERPFTGGRIVREVPLQLEVPGIDEVMWAKGDVVFDQLVPSKDLVHWSVERASSRSGPLTRMALRLWLARQDARAGRRAPVGH